MSTYVIRLPESNAHRIQRPPEIISHPLFTPVLDFREGASHQQNQRSGSDGTRWHAEVRGGTRSRIAISGTFIQNPRFPPYDLCVRCGTRRYTTVPGWAPVDFVDTSVGVEAETLVDRGDTSHHCESCGSIEFIPPVYSFHIIQFQWSGSFTTNTKMGNSPFATKPGALRKAWRPASCVGKLKSLSSAHARVASNCCDGRAAGTGSLLERPLHSI